MVDTKALDHLTPRGLVGFQNLWLFIFFVKVLGWLDGMVEASCRLFWAMLAPRWRCLVDVGAMLRHVGDKMATKSAKMRHHKRKRAPRLVRVGPVDSGCCGEGRLGSLKE